jgi:HrpA-like RNA helicase
VSNAVNGLFRMGALNEAGDDATVTPLGHLMAALGLELAVARLVVLGGILDIPALAVVLGAALTCEVTDTSR